MEKNDSSVDISKLFDEDNYTSEYIRLIKSYLSTMSINPDISLLTAISNAKSTKSLLPIGLCLRLSNPNMYVNYPGVSEHIHILGYAYLSTSPGAVQNAIMILLILAGSSLNKPIFDENRGGIRSEKDLINLNYITVERWLYSRGYSLTKEIAEKGLNVIPEKNLDVLRVLLDEYARIDNELLIKSLGDNIAKIFTPSDAVSLWKSIDLDNSIKFYNLKTYEKVESFGYVITYPMMNDLILKATREKNDVLLNDLIGMIKVSITNGYEFDIHQMTLLQSLSPELFTSIKEKYTIPRWKRACNNSHNRENPEDLPLKVKRDIIGANIQLSTGVCSYLESIDKTDLKELISASQTHKSAKLNAELAVPSDYIGKRPESITFANSELLKSSPQNYGDIYEVHYIDSMGKRWIFTSDLFETLLETKLNPVTLERLPSQTLENISFRKKILTQLGISLAKPVTIDESLKRLREPDDISDNNDQYLHTLKLSGVDIDLNKLQQADFSKLQKLNIDVNLSGLPKSHQITTVLWILVWLSKVKPDLLKFVVLELF